MADPADFSDVDLFHSPSKKRTFARSTHCSCYIAIMPSEDVHVLAEVRLLATNEGGKTVPICGSYRPNHNFFDVADAVMTFGAIEIPVGVVVQPGESITVPITFWWWPGLEGQIYVGREWRIQEGPHLVGFGRVVEVNADDL